MNETAHDSIQAIAFDVDGTFYPQWKLLKTSLGFYIRNCHLVQRYWKVRRNLRSKEYLYEAEGREGLLFHQAQMYADLTGESVSKVEKLLNEKIYGEWEATFQNLQILPGVEACLKELRQRGYTLAVMSDFPVEQKLRYFGIQQYFDVAITSESSGYLKPHPAAYQYLAQQLALEPEHILYVGNSYRNDIEGAKHSGFRAAYFARKDKKGSEADFQFASYNQFLLRFEQC